MTKAQRQEEREADRIALEGIVQETVAWAVQLTKDGGAVGDPIGIAMDAHGGGLADKHGHGFDRDLLDEWEQKCRAAYAEAME
jgi:hypothetical protein